MTMEMRDLQGKDLFPMLAIIGKIGVKEDFLKLFKGEDLKPKPEDHKKKKPTKAEQEAAQVDVEARGMEVVANLLEKVMLNAGQVSGDLNALLADLTGSTKKQIDELSIEEYGGLVVSFFKKPELRTFFQQLASFIK